MRIGFLALLWFFGALVPFRPETNAGAARPVGVETVEQQTRDFTANGGIISVPDGKD